MTVKHKKVANLTITMNSAVLFGERKGLCVLALSYTTSEHMVSTLKQSTKSSIYNTLKAEENRQVQKPARNRTRV